MIDPMGWFRPEDAAEAAYAAASREYLRIANISHTVPPLESVFPALCNFVKLKGLKDPMEAIPGSRGAIQMQLDRLRSYILYAFRVVPYLAPQLVNTTALLDTMMDQRRKSNNAESHCDNKDEDSRANDDEKQKTPNSSVASDGTKKERISPYRVERELIRKETIRIIGEALYVYADGYFQHISAECLRRLIVKNCRYVVEKAETPRFIDDVYRHLLCDPDLYRQEEEVDSNLVAFDNGVLDMSTSRLTPFSPKHGIFYRIRTEWGTHQPHPCFDAFLEDVTGGDHLLRQRILEVIGYCLSPDIRGKAFFVFQGHPDTGKSILAKLIRSFLNADACLGLDITSLGERFAAANLVGKQLCLSMDIASTPLGAKTVATFKSITGGDPITADVKYAPHITFFNRAKFILGTNHPLLIQGEDPAFFRRAVAIPFQYSVPREKQDPHLLERLEQERASIAFDAIQAYYYLRARGYVFAGTFPLNAMFLSETSSLQSTEEMLRQFVQTQCVIDAEAIAFVDDLYEKFCENYPATAVKESWFGAKLLETCESIGFSEVHRGVKKRKPGHPNPQANLVGIRLKGGDVG